MITRKSVKQVLAPTAEERGVVLVIALLVMALLSLLGVSFLGMSGIESTITYNTVNAAQAFNLAEAGVTLGKRTLMDSADWDTELAAPQPFPCPALVPASNGGCSYRIENDAADPGGPLGDTDGIVVIKATGQFQTAAREIEVVVSGPVPSFLIDALFGVEYVEISGKTSGGTDSFDSRVGPYDPATAGSEGDVGSNGDIEVLGGTVVNGDATAVGAALVTGTVTGTVTTGAPPRYVPPVASCGPPYSDGTGISGTYTYDPATGVLQISGGNNVTLADGGYCFSTVQVSGGSTVQVDGPVTFSLTGYLEMSGGSFVNSTADAANLAIYSSYTGDFGRPDHGGVELSGGGTAYMTVYAPYTSVEISGASDFYGAVVGKRIEARGGPISTTI